MIDQMVADFFLLLGFIYWVILMVKLIRWLWQGKWQRERPHTPRTPEL